MITSILPTLLRPGMLALGLLLAACATPEGEGKASVPQIFTDRGTFEVELMFENKSKRFPGGANTLDGVTKPLFGGTDVPDLWVGTLSTRTTFTVQ